LNLFYNPTTGALKTNGATIEEIITYAISKGVNLQLGTVTPAFNLPVYPCRNMMCSEAIQICLRPTPDAVTWIDYTTTPPTFNCQQRADLTPITMPYASTSSGVKHKSSELVPRYDLQATEVVLRYQKTNSITSGGDTAVWNTYSSDVYPPGSTGAIGSLVEAIDLRGAQLKAASLTAAAFDPTDKAWWKKHKNDLNESGDTPTGRATGIAISNITVKKEDGTDIDYSGSGFPRELTDGVFASWMRNGSGTQINVVDAIVTADLALTETDPNSTSIPTRIISSHRVMVRVKLTNSAVGTYQYTTVSSFDEIVPDGLALDTYDTLQTLQYDGTHEVLEVNGITAIHGPWELLNLSGGATDWATMNATIQSARFDFFEGRTEITIGPAKHLAPGDKAELLAWARFRQPLEDPAVQKTGQLSGGNGQMTLGKNTPRENTAEGLPVLKLHTVTHPADEEVTNVIIHDAENHWIQLHVAANDDGTRIDTGGGVDIRRDDCHDGDGNFRILTVREVDICVSGTPMKCLVVASAPY
jgi:hypothetical protein